MECPYCTHKDHLELDMHADGYSSILLECTECGALLKLKHLSLETVNGPIPPSLFSHKFAEESESLEINREKRIQGLIEVRNALLIS